MLIPLTVVLASDPASFLSSAWMSLGALVSIALASIAAHGIARMATLAGGVILVRGTSYVGWDSPTQCRDFTVWLAYDWNFLGTGGVHRGERLLGLSVAVVGTL